MKLRKLIFLAAFNLILIGGSLMAAADIRFTASAPKNTFKLGEIIPVTISAKNLDQNPTTIKEMKLGRGFVEFEITFGEDENGKPRKFTFTRINGDAYQPTAPKDVTVNGGEEASAVINIPAIFPGKVTITPILWGKVQLETQTFQISGDGKVAGLKFETDQGQMKAALLPEVAPNTAANIALLVHEGFYNGIVFHRIISNFMIQGGDPDGVGTGGPGFSLPAEFNPVKHVKGILSMARSQHPDSAGSQFFIMHGVAPSLDNQYTVFGKLVSGINVLDKIANLPVKPGPGGENSQPVNKPVIKSVSIIAVDVEK